MSDHSLSSSRSQSSKRRETDEERAIRKEKERKARENETEAERKIRKEKERRREEEKRASRIGHEKRKETDEERRIRKEKEALGMRRETDEERRIRKEKEALGMRRETEEERRIRKEKERRERGKETEEERRIRKEREKKNSKEFGEDKRIEKEIKVKPEAKEVLYTKIKEETGPSVKSEMLVKEEKAEEINSSMKEESMDDTDEDVPLAKRKKPIKDDSDNDSDKRKKAGKKRKADSGDDSDVPLSKRKENVKKRKADDAEDDDDDLKKPSKKRSKIKQDDDDDDFKPEKKSKKTKKLDEDEDDFKPDKKSKQKVSKAGKGKTKGKGKAKQSEEVEGEKKDNAEPTKKMTKKEKELEEEKNVWKWWEEKTDKVDDGTKWHFLEHKGPLLAPEYVRLPPEVRFRYNGKVMQLEQLTEEVCTFYGKMLDHDYTTKEVFNKNFMKDWRKIMTQEERDKIRDLSKCDFSEINEHFKKISEERKARSKEEKKAEKEANAKIQDEYGVCTLDGHQEKIGNYRVEPPGLFRGRGEHPKQGMVKNRLEAKDIIINCSKDSKYPEPPPGQSWKEIRHDNTVTWLASWTENIQGQIKYVMLNPSSKLKGEKDMEKYEKARELKKHIDSIRADYKGDYKHKEMRIRQRAVALYFIDILALRAGNEKDDDQADTVGCCSLRVEHVELFEEKDGQEYVIEFDFLGKDSIRYFNSVPVEKRVWKNVKLFKEDKKPEDDLFDRLNTGTLNAYLDSLMPGLTAKVFRTYNASSTLQRQLNALTDPSGTVAAKMLSYNRANRDVAVLCNHQRAVPKTFDKAMANLEEKIEKKGEAIKEAEKELKAAKKAFKKGEEKNKEVVEKKKKAVGRLMEQLEKLEIQRTDKDENKTIALGTSKLNYLDPRISVAWCKKHEVAIEKVYTKTHRQKFMWAINMAGPDYEF